jgi:predicted ATPase with chaperone activity
MLARRLATILLPLAFSEALEVTKLYSITGSARHRPPHPSPLPLPAPAALMAVPRPECRKVDPGEA